MNARYIAKQPYAGTLIPRCDLSGSPFTSRRKAQQAAHKAGIENPVIETVRRIS